ncbi:VanZ family protein [Exiguobacterium sp. s133]|uniref:VanZ family protein n=1 Tax=Exiguobacterium sp. s133 TaxID=2751213 RepID=UPI001BE7BA09|nr:VanZ family protein [Exiguobacterium sp. s133]
MVTFLFPSILIIIIGAVFFSIKLKKDKISKLYFFYGIVFSVYIASLISLTLFPFPYQQELINDVIEENYGEVNNFTPFKAFVESFSTPINREALTHLVQNILLFLPLGFILPIFFVRIKKISIVFIGFMVSLTIETLQLLGGLYIGYNYRSFDVDDLILNTLGTAVGVLMFIILSKFLRKADLLENKKVTIKA